MNVPGLAMPEAGRKESKWTKLCNSIAEPGCKRSEIDIGKLNFTMPKTRIVNPNCKEDLDDMIRSMCTRSKAGKSRSR